MSKECAWKSGVPKYDGSSQTNTGDIVWTEQQTCTLVDPILNSHSEIDYGLILVNVLVSGAGRFYSEAFDWLFTRKRLLWAHAERNLPTQSHSFLGFLRPPEAYRLVAGPVTCKSLPYMGILLRKTN